MVADDPFAALEQAAHRMTAETKAAEAVKRARVRLVLGKDAKSAFFATTAMRLTPVVDWECETAATDGKKLIYSPDFICGLGQEEVIGLMVHEVMHCTQRHHTRRNGRDEGQWNIACDLAINNPIRDAGFRLPKGGLFAGEGQYAKFPAGLSAEDYYSRLQEQKKPDDQPGDMPGQGQPGDGAGDADSDGDGDGHGNDPGQCGGVMDAGDNAKQREADAEWQQATAQAMEVAKGRGDMPGMLGGLLGSTLEPEVDWKEVLRDFVSGVMMAREDYSWSTPNRRFISQGLYLPSLRSPTLGHIVIHRDVSGSLWDADQQSRFVAEINGVLECNPCRVSIVFGDTQVQRVDEWQPADGPLTIDDYPGGGGTNHTHLWRWMSEQDEEPACVVCLTDGETDFGSGPGVPVLWALTKPCQVPFGQSLLIK